MISPHLYQKSLEGPFGPIEGVWYTRLQFVSSKDRRDFPCSLVKGSWKRQRRSSLENRVLLKGRNLSLQLFAFGYQRVFLRDKSVLVNFYNDSGSVGVLLVLRQLRVDLYESANLISERFLAISLYTTCRS